MVTGADGHVILIEHLSEIVRMHPFEVERENAEPALTRLYQP